jgi:hypothetical protein
VRIRWTAAAADVHKTKQFTTKTLFSAVALAAIVAATLENDIKAVFERWNNSLKTGDPDEVVKSMRSMQSYCRMSLTSHGSRSINGTNISQIFSRISRSRVPRTHLALLRLTSSGAGFAGRTLNAGQFNGVCRAAAKLRCV